MPLMHGKSQKSFGKNVATEMEHGHPLKQSLAIAYATKRAAQKKAKGGVMCAYGHPMAEGGFVKEEESSGYAKMPEDHTKPNKMAMEESDRGLGQHGEMETAAYGMTEDNEPQHDIMYAHKEENQSFPEEERDLVSRVMKKKQMHYSEGGKVANDSMPMADSQSSEFDDLVKDDDLDSSYTGENSGDEDGNEDEDMRRSDIVSWIMKQKRMKKDRNPVPA